MTLFLALKDQLLVSWTTFAKKSESDGRIQFGFCISQVGRYSIPRQVIDQRRIITPNKLTEVREA